MSTATRFLWIMASGVLMLCVGAFAGLGLLVYLLYLDTRVPMVLRNEVATEEKPEYGLPVSHGAIMPGEYQTIHADACIYTSSRGEGEVTLANEVLFVLPRETIAISNLRMESGECGQFDFALRIPDIATSGEYHFEGIVEYPVNFLAVRQVYWRSEPFQVIGLTDEGQN